MSGPSFVHSAAKAFARQHDRKRHEKVHYGEKQFVCGAGNGTDGQQGCGRAFFRRDGLARHLRSDTGSACTKTLFQETKWRRLLSQQSSLGRYPAVLAANVVALDNCGAGSGVLPSALLIQSPSLADKEYPRSDTNGGFGGAFSIASLVDDSDRGGDNVFQMPLELVGTCLLPVVRARGRWIDDFPKLGPGGAAEATGNLEAWLFFVLLMTQANQLTPGSTRWFCSPATSKWSGGAANKCRLLHIPCWQRRLFPTSPGRRSGEFTNHLCRRRFRINHDLQWLRGVVPIVAKFVPSLHHVFLATFLAFPPTVSRPKYGTTDPRSSRTPPTEHLVHCAAHVSSRWPDDAPAPQDGSSRSPSMHTSLADPRGLFLRLHVVSSDLRRRVYPGLTIPNPYKTNSVRFSQVECASTSTSISMNSRLMVSSNPFDLRPLDGEKSLATNQLDGQWGGAYSLDNSLVMKEPESPPASTDIFGNNLSIGCIDGTMADLDARKFAMNGRSNNGMQFPDPFYPRTTSNFMSDPSSDGINSSLSEDVAIYTIPSTESPSPQTKPSTVKKRGRPRKARPASTTGAIYKTDPSTGSKRWTSTKSEAEASGADDPRAVRVREKNRIAADKCRSRRRQEEDKIKSKHEDLEREHGRLSGALSELMAETYLLKNMLMEHGNCDCRLIQDFLKESASEWVAKKLKASASPVGTSS
ncbi:hypothetical protein PCL_11335 [Purpureocillium lilacinum]|uniref:BZIP domain-containing protein n=1 Tax=Purpureocillium lilacinum TaxID=33203 RepID=A0A2U3DPT5_PURLI|nr:hypothetical protein PCL_11335 [Purpureocillium lilacinum]